MSTIYIISDHGKLQKKGDTLQLYAQDGTITIIFPYKTEQLVIVGNVEITSAALKLLMRYNLDTVFLGKNGKFNGKLAFQEGKNVFLRQKQFDLLKDMDFRLNFAKSIVNGKLKNQLSFMQRIKRGKGKGKGLENAVDSMKHNLKNIESVEIMEALRGYEGMGARYFFSVFRQNIIQDWAVFNGRSMHPPQDNVNAVLSFLYTMLFFRIDGAIEAEGLDSYVGYFHELNYGKRTLSYDLMEEYRTPIADTLCCALFNLGILEQDDFESITFSSNSTDYPLQTEGQNIKEDDNIGFEEKKGVLLTKKGLKKVITQLEKKLETKVYYDLLNQHISYKRVIREQIKHFKRVINKDEKAYRPMVIK